MDNTMPPQKNTTSLERSFSVMPMPSMTLPSMVSETIVVKLSHAMTME